MTAKERQYTLDNTRFIVDQVAQLNGDGRDDLAVEKLITAVRALIRVVEDLSAVVGTMEKSAPTLAPGIIQALNEGDGSYKP